MATKSTAKKPVKATPAITASDKPAGDRSLVFAKRCTNGHGSFAKGDRARGAFPQSLVDTYLQVGILVKAPPVASDG